MLYTCNLKAVLAQGYETLLRSRVSTAFAQPSLISEKRSGVCLLLLGALQTANQKLSSEAHVTSVTGNECRVNRSQ